MTDRYDPHRAHPDTVRSIILWHLDGGFEGHEGASLGELCADLRTQCVIRTQAEVALDIARLVVFGGTRCSGGAEQKGGVLLKFEGTLGGSAKLSDLCAEFAHAPLPPVVAPARDYGPSGAAAKESREDIAAPGAATTEPTESVDERIAELERQVRGMVRAELGPCQLVPALLGRVEELERGAGLGTRPAPEVAAGTEEDHPETCGCEETEALRRELTAWRAKFSNPAVCEREIAALRARVFDLSAHLGRLRKLAMAPAGDPDAG